METKVELNPNALKAHNLEALTADLDVPKFYSNGFQAQLTLADANIILVQNNVPIGVLVTTLSGAKSLRNQLDLLLKKYTEDIDDVLSYEELLERAQKKAKEKAGNGNGK